MITTTKCTTCHTGASTLFPISSNAETMFKLISEHSRTMLELFALDLTVRPGGVVVNAAPFKGVATGIAPYEAHPRLSVAGAPTSALVKFYDATAARRAARMCDPPRLKD
jgi:hypothetical protein